MTAFVDPHRSFDEKTHDVRWAGLARIATTFVRTVLLWPVRLHARRQLLERMSLMSDYELSDIGLTRIDLADSAALPLTSELGGFLETRAAARRRWSRR